MGRQDGSARRVSGPDVDDAQTPILHADLDAFFASVELLTRPHLRGLPVIVGRRGPRSVVTAATYEARAYGVNSAMPMALALRRCPRAVVVEPSRGAYAYWSRRFFEICRSITPLVEEVGIDEGFLDVRGAALAVGTPRRAAEVLRTRVREQTGLVVSVGVAATKYVAKLASGMSKPDGLLVVPAADTVEFLRPLPIEAMWGVGASTARRLHDSAVHTIGDLAALPGPALERLVGAANARRLGDLARGIDPRPVSTTRVEQSIGRETTFDVDVTDPGQLRTTLLRLADDVGARLRRSGVRARSLSVKLRFGDFRTISRSATLAEPTDSTRSLHHSAQALLDASMPLPPVRLIGVRAEQLQRAGESPPALWEDDSGWRDAEAAVDRARDRFGAASLGPARLLGAEAPDRERHAQRD